MGSIPLEEIYCTDFESEADIYNNWDSVDDTTDFTSGSGGIDTWTRSSRRSHSASHSFHCTQFDDRYMGNQLDYLTTSFENTEEYEDIEITFWIWCEGEIVDVGDICGVPKDYGYGFRGPEDKIWGLWEDTILSLEMSHHLGSYIEEHGMNLDIIYGSEIETNEIYRKYIFWNGIVVSDP